MHDALVGLLDKVDTAVAESAGALRRTDVESVAALARDTRMRLSCPESIVVVALAGGTGSGKSSLVNAIAGEEVALTGGIRPLTSNPSLWCPQMAPERSAGIWTSWGSPTVSSIAAHRGSVSSISPTTTAWKWTIATGSTPPSRVDMVVWVTDPEKYRDAVIHHRYISAMSGYQEQFLFVLNQIDRLDPEDAGRCGRRPGQGTARGWHPRPKVIATAASPVAGLPRGGPADGRAGGALERRLAVNRKALADLARASSRLVTSSSTAHAVDFEKQWAEEVASACDLAIAGRAAGGGHDLAEYVAHLATEMGGETEHRLQDLAIETHAAFLRCVAAQARPPDRCGPG